jgi:hypothetical protein
MRTQDILALSNRPFAGERTAPDRRGLLLGAVLAAVIVFGLIAGAALPHARASVPDADPDVGHFATNLDRGGSLYTLEIQF